MCHIAHLLVSAQFFPPVFKLNQVFPLSLDGLLLIVLSVSPFLLADFFLLFPQPVASNCVCAYLVFSCITKFWIHFNMQSGMLNCNARKWEECGFHLMFIVYPFCFILFKSMICFLLICSHLLTVSVIQYYK